MTIFEQIKEVLKNEVGTIVTSKEVIDSIHNKYGTNPKSIILSDYCYNRFNKGIKFDKHLFQYVNKNSYKYLGENYKYTGLIYHKAKGCKKELIVGEWKNGIKTLDDSILTEKSNDKLSSNIEMISRLYEEYSEILRVEMNLLNCKATELRHLIGRIGEFICAINTNGELAKVTNQQGFDVVSNGRRISVKTTAQIHGFIKVNQNTFNQFDDLYVIQYMDDEFKEIYYGPKENVLEISRVYKNNYEIDINKLKSINNIR